MFNIKPVALLIPPLNFGIILFLFAHILMYRNRINTSKIFYLLSFVWIVGWSLPITSLLIGGFLENYNIESSDLNNKKYDAIVVLGGNIRHGQINWFSDYDKKTAKTRIDIASKLYFSGASEIIICSGGSLDNKTSEAKYMSMIAKQKGIPEQNIYLEERSRTTYENAVFTNEKTKFMNLNSIILVTSALHMPRAKATFIKVGFKNIVTFPTHSQIVWNDNKFHLYIPSYKTLQASKTIIKEYVAIFTYWYRGWI